MKVRLPEYAGKTLPRGGREGGEKEGEGDDASIQGKKKRKRAPGEDFLSKKRGESGGNAVAGKEGPRGRKGITC